MNKAMIMEIPSNKLISIQTNARNNAVLLRLQKELGDIEKEREQSVYLINRDRFDMRQMARNLRKKLPKRQPHKNHDSFVNNTTDAARNGKTDLTGKTQQALERVTIIQPQRAEVILPHAKASSMQQTMFSFPLSREIIMESTPKPFLGTTLKRGNILMQKRSGLHNKRSLQQPTLKRTSTIYSQSNITSNKDVLTTNCFQNLISNVNDRTFPWSSERELDPALSRTLLSAKSLQEFPPDFLKKTNNDKIQTKVSKLHQDDRNMRQKHLIPREVCKAEDKVHDKNNPASLNNIPLHQMAEILRPNSAALIPAHESDKRPTFHEIRGIMSQKFGKEKTDITKIAWESGKEGLGKVDQLVNENVMTDLMNNKRKRHRNTPLGSRVVNFMKELESAKERLKKECHPSRKENIRHLTFITKGAAAAIALSSDESDDE